MMYPLIHQETNASSSRLAGLCFFVAMKYRSTFLSTYVCTKRSHGNKLDLDSLETNNCYS